MSLIDNTYFVLEINIPESTIGTDDLTDLTAYIAKYEKEILQRLLGYELWKLVDAYTDGDTGVIADLVEGVEYTASNGDLVKWNGLINDDKVSLIAYYVYYWYVRNNSTSLQNIGNIKLASENSTNATAIMTITDAWNRLENLYGQCSGYGYQSSAYNFLTEKESDYPTWVFTGLGNVNSFDL